MFFKKLLIVLLFLLIIFGFSYGVVWFYENAAMEKSAEQSQTNAEPVAEQWWRNLMTGRYCLI